MILNRPPNSTGRQCKIHPEIPELKANLGLMYYQIGKDQQAIDAFSQAIRLKPGLFVPNLVPWTRLCEVEAVQ